MRTQKLDCLVIGGGPGGATLALHLAQRGIGVALIDHGRAHYSGPFETVLASTKSTWQRMGLLETVKQGLAEDPLRHGAIWGSNELQWRQDEEAGLLLRRGVFDTALRATARSAGAEVYETCRAERGLRGWQLVSESGETILLQPTLLAYATGRAALPGLPKNQPVGPETTAVTVLGGPAPDDRGSAVVEAVRNGWIWTHVEHGLQEAHSRSANAFYEVESRFAAEPFWQRRQVSAPDPTQLAGGQVLRRLATV